MSYFWGGPEKTKTIILNDKRVQVTENLEASLRRLSWQLQRTPLWVDAICIDQNDILEKANQLGEMFRIYQNAQYVLVRLGDETPKSPQAMDFLRAVQTGMKNEHGLHGGNSRRNIANVAPTQKGDTTLRMTNPNIKSFTSQMQQVTNATVINAEFQTCSAANPILDILMRPYWRRAWVLQEFAVARDAFFVCGSQIMHWQELYEAIQTIVGCYERSPEDWFSIEPLWLPVLRMFFVRNHFHNCPLNLLLGHLLIETSTANQYLNATDPRDKIFSLLGLSCDATDLGIRAYYDTS